VLSADWRKLAEYQPVEDPMTAHLSAESPSASDNAKEGGAEDFLQAFLMAEPDGQSDLLELHLQALAARVFRMDRERIQVSQPLGALGLDSMMAMELKSRMESSLHIPRLGARP
jgi:hybrid polyketide synthase/nonribosomal peptide synthetase FtdB